MNTSDYSLPNIRRITVQFECLADAESPVADKLAGDLYKYGVAQRTRFEDIGGPAALEEALSSLQTAVELTDDGHPAKSVWLSSLIAC
jgi:hypothetical protein